MNKLWLVLKNRNTKRTWTKYFEKESDMNEFINKIKWVKELFVIEDSRDIIYI